MQAPLIYDSSSLRALAEELGFDDFGIASATLGTPTRDHFQEALADDRHGPLDYLERTEIERADVQKLMPDAKSVIVLVKNYYTGDHHDFVSLESLNSKAKVSRYAWGGDYHHWFRKRLRKLRSHLIETAGASAKVHIFNDTGPVLERAWAHQAGLGFIGKSSMFIHRKYGTWVLLGGLVTNVEMQANTVQQASLCGSCTRCLEACPTKAIIAPKKVDARRCLTTWNVERPNDKNADASEMLGHKWVVGCDICQEVCPWNKFEQRTLEPRFQPRVEHVVLSEAPLGDLRGTPLARPGANGITLSLKRSLSR